MKLLTLLASGAAVGVGAQIGVPLGPMEVKKKHDGVRGAAPQVVGRPRPLDPDSQGAREAAALAVGRFNAVANVARRHDLARIVGGTSQVVAGVRYALDLELAEVDCPSGTPAEAPCPALAGGASRTIHATVWSRPWLPAESRAQIELSETVNGEVVALPAAKAAEPAEVADGEAASDSDGEGDGEGSEEQERVSGEAGAAVAPGFNHRDEGSPGEADIARAEEKESESDGEGDEGGNDSESESESEPDSEQQNEEQDEGSDGE